MRRKQVLVVIALLLVSLGACGTQPLLLNVAVRPEVITPNGDGKDDVAELKYSLSANANISVTLLSADGKTYNLRANQARSAGDYQLLFGGVVGGVVLPNGAYTVAVEASPADGRAPAPVERVERPVTVKDSNVQLPEIQNFTVFPDHFTPNRDGIDDRVSITYNLTKKADVFVYLLGSDGRKWPVAERADNATKPGEPGVHTYDYEGGVDLDAPPPPDGSYQVIAEATDATGNHISASAPLTISEGGVPRAEIVGATATIAPSSVPIGASLLFTATVSNVGVVPIRTKPPWSGVQYTSLENFNNLGQYEEPGVFRVGLDFEGNSSGRPYPYRWGLGRQSDLTARSINGQTYYYLMPNQRAVVSGSIKLVDKAQFNPVTPFFWVGLLHEQVRIVMDRIAPTRITIGF